MESNTLIAEFMGCTHLVYTLKTSQYQISQGTFELDELQYHNSWNWLMPVANEIIKSRDEQNADWDLTNLKYALQTTNIEYVYKAVVEFINEYNKRK